MYELTQNQEETSCNRVRAERREANLRSCFYALFMNRRRGDRRRDHSNENVYTDDYGPKIMLGAVAVMIFCVLDAFFTLILIGRGASEINPFMAWVMQFGDMWFYTSKYLITAVCVIWMVMHKQFDFFGFKGRHLMLVTLACYVTLITYQISMLIESSHL